MKVFKRKVGFWRLQQVFTRMRRKRSASLCREHEPTVPADRWQFAALGGAVAAFLYAHLFKFPFVPIWRNGDQFFWLEHADRMLHGEVLYRDLFQFNLPGTECLYYVLFRCLGATVWVAPLTLLLTGTAITLLLFSLSRKVISGTAALLPPVAYLVICQRTSLDAAHTWFSTLLVLIAVNWIAEYRYPARLCAAGTLLGLASLFTSSRGVFVVAGISVFILWELRPGSNAANALATLLLPFATVVGGTMSYLAHLVGTKLLVESVIIFPLRYYSAGDANNMSSVLSGMWQSVLPLRSQSILLVSLFLVLNIGVPLTLILFVARAFRGRAVDPRVSTGSQTLVLYAVVGFALFLSVASAPTAPRLNCAAAFASVIAVAMLRSVGGRRASRGLLAVTVMLGLIELTTAEMRLKRTVNGPRGAMAFQTRDRYSQFEWIAQHARARDGLFGDADLDFFFELRNPTPLPWVGANAYTRPEQIKTVVAALERQHTQFVVWSDDLENCRGTGDNLQPLRLYLRQDYRLARKFDDGTEMLERLTQE